MSFSGTCCARALHCFVMFSAPRNPKREATAKGLEDVVQVLLRPKNQGGAMLSA